MKRKAGTYRQQPGISRSFLSIGDSDIFTLYQLISKERSNNRWIM